MKHDYDAVMQSALSYPIDVQTVPAKGIPIEFKANEKERAALAQNHALLAVSSFSADFYISQWKKRGIRIKGRIYAEITQECGVSLESISEIIDELLDVIMVPSDSRLAKPKFYDDTGELFVDAEGSDAPEVFEGDKINIGEIAEEFFELAINPYPRKPGLELVEFQSKKSDDEDKIRPFDALRKLKDT